MPSFFPPALTAYICFLAFAFGACLGCFLDCAAWRVARKQSFIKGRSHCASCGATLQVMDLVPILSWLFLRGKCRRCGAKIGVRCPLVEALCGLLFLSALLRFGLSWQTLEAVILFCVLLFLALVDLETMELPGIPMILGAVNFLVFLFAYSDPLRRLWWGAVGAVAIGGGMLLFSLLADKVMGRETMGGGDIKLLALLGLYLGPDGGLLLLILSCVAGLLLAFLMKAGRGKEFPFGPAIALAAWPCLLFGSTLLAWYWNLCFPG